MTDPSGHPHQRYVTQRIPADQQPPYNPQVNYGAGAPYPPNMYQQPTANQQQFVSPYGAGVPPPLNYGQGPTGAYPYANVAPVPVAPQYSGPGGAQRQPFVAGVIPPSASGVRPAIHIPPRNHTTRNPPPRAENAPSMPNARSNTLGAVPYDSQRGGDDASPLPTPPTNLGQASPAGLVIPERVRSKKKTVEQLLDLGASLFAPPLQKYTEAYVKWDMAFEQAQKEDDLLGQAKALSNMGCAYRALSQFENALNCQKRSWKATMAYVKDMQGRMAELMLSPGNHAQLGDSSHWFGMVHRTLDLDITDRFSLDLEDITAGVADMHIKQGRGAIGPQDPFCGPPIVVWFLDLTSNLGNAYFSVGKFEHALNWFTKCLQLAEVVLEENALPASFDRNLIEGNSQMTTMPGNRNHAGANRAQKIKLSYLHRCTLLAQARSLTHIGVCCQHLGLDDTSLQCHSHSASILSFYTSRSPSFTYAEKAENTDGAKKADEGSSNPSLKSWQASEAECYQASVSCNLATAYYAKGRLPASIERLERAATRYKAASNTLGLTRAISSLGALRIEVGRTLGNLHWIRNMEAQAVGAGEVNECMRYWGPPRLKGVNLNSGEWDESASISVGSSWNKTGIKIMLEQLKIMKEKDDLFGVLVNLLNIAAGYVAERHPYMALYMIGRLLTEHTASSNSYVVTHGNEQRSIPPFLQLHTAYTICQAVFLLTRFQRAPDQPVYPGPIADDQDGFPFFDPSSVNEVLNALGLGYCSVEVPELDLLIAGYLANQETMVQLRSDIQESPAYSILYTYMGNITVGVDGPGSVKLTPQTAAAKDVAGSTQAAQMGVGVGMDMVRQKAAILSAMAGKADWMLGARYDIVFNERQAREYYLEGTGKLDRAAKEAVKALSAAANNTPGAAPNAKAEAGLISAFFDLTGAAFAVPPVNPSAPPSYTHAPASYSPIFTPALRAASFVTPSLFALAADTMAFAAYQLQARAGAVGAATGYAGSAAAAAAAQGLDLLKILRIPVQPPPARVHRELLGASAAMFANVLGWCEVCMRENLSEPDSGVTIVFQGRDGTIGAVGDISATSRPADVKVKFPCEHYYWRG